MADTKKRTTKKKEEAIKSVGKQEPTFWEAFAMRHQPPSQHYIESIARRMIAWSELPDSYILTKFMVTLPHAPKQIYDWAKDWPQIEYALDVARANIAARREERAAASNQDYYKIYERNQAVYDMPYRDLIKWREDIKPKAQESGPTTVNVMVPEFATTDIVPDVRKPIGSAGKATG
jgi:hypothetical protein